MSFLIEPGVTITGSITIRAEPLVPTVIGEVWGGGYYAGQISTTGDGVATHYLIVAPKSSGESSKQYRINTSTTTGASSVIDGPTNTANMDSATFPAAQFCAGLTIGGYSDWYMPAKNELEVCYYNLKPSTTNNTTSSGANANSVPKRNSNYTTGTPGQTSATDFRTVGAQAFGTGFPLGWYWTSTHNVTSAAWLQIFDNGNQTGTTVTETLSVRAVRRIPI